MIIVTGATGQLGGQIVQRLLTRVPADQVGVSVRDPRKAQGLADRGVRVRQGDFADAAGLAHAFEDATQVLIVSANRRADEAVRLNRAAIDAAVAAGARRVIYTSHMGAGHSSRFGPCRVHAATEDALRACGVPFTALRNGFYASSAVRYFSPALQAGQVALPQDGPVNWTAHADLAEAATAILTGEGRFDGPTPPLTAERALTFDDIATIATQVTGRTLKRITAPDAQFKDQMVSRGTPAELAELALDMFRAARAGEFTATDPTLTNLIGRETTTMHTVLQEQLPRTA